MLNAVNIQYFIFASCYYRALAIVENERFEVRGGL
jgi:hypothetical protein